MLQPRLLLKDYRKLVFEPGGSRRTLPNLRESDILSGGDEGHLRFPDQREEQINDPYNLVEQRVVAFGPTDGDLVTLTKVSRRVTRSSPATSRIYSQGQGFNRSMPAGGERAA